MITYDEQVKISKTREYKVVKHNDIIQKSRFKLSTVEQKTVAFLVSLIKPKEEYPNGIQPIEYEFEIQDYCKVCGIDYKQGNNYKMVRDTLKSLRDKSVIVTLPNGTDTPVSWITKFWSNKGNGKAKIRFDDDMAPYIFDLCDRRTQFDLLNVLPMQSKYSIRLYEICRSWSGIRNKTYSLEEIRELLGVEKNELIRYPDFRRYVLEIAKKEINEHTDLEVNFEPITKGRKTIAISLHIKEKGLINKLISQANVHDKLNTKDKIKAI